MEWDFKRLRSGTKMFKLNTSSRFKKKFERSKITCSDISMNSLETPTTSKLSSSNISISCTKTLKRYKTSSPKTYSNSLKISNNYKHQQLINENNAEVDTLKYHLLDLPKKEIILTSLPILPKETLSNFVTQINEKLLINTQVENLLIETIENFVSSIIHGSCHIAKHRKGKNIEVKDVKLYLSFYNNKLHHHQHQRSIKTEHKERMALIKKILKQHK